MRQLTSLSGGVALGALINNMRSFGALFNVVGDKIDFMADLSADVDPSVFDEQ